MTNKETKSVVWHEKVKDRVCEKLDLLNSQAYHYDKFRRELLDWVINTTISEVEANIPDDLEEVSAKGLRREILTRLYTLTL